MIIFMNAQTASLDAGSNCLSGASLRSRWRMPTSVATMNRDFSELRASRIMPSVERMFIWSFPKAMHWLAQPHSGWTMNSVSGDAVCQRSMSSVRIPACTWHSPSQILSLRPVTRCR